MARSLLKENQGMMYESNAAGVEASTGKLESMCTYVHASWAELAEGPCPKIPKA